MSVLVVLNKCDTAESTEILVLLTFPFSVMLEMVMVDFPFSEAEAMAIVEVKGLTAIEECGLSNRSENTICPEDKSQPENMDILSCREMR